MCAKLLGLFEVIDSSFMSFMGVVMGLGPVPPLEVRTFPL